MSIREDALKLHEKLRGKIGMYNKYNLVNPKDLALIYTPGVAEPCKEIAINSSKVYDYTFKGNTIAIVSDGTRVLGLGNIGPEAGLPVMEGKAMLFKQFGGVDAVPICINRETPQDVINTIKSIAPSFGGINLEDIESPDCFFIEESLQEIGIPVFHDDQHGTAIAIVAALKNALKFLKKDINSAKVVLAGGGAAGLAAVNLMHAYGFENIVLVDSKGIINKGRNDLNEYKIRALDKVMNHVGTLEDACKEADAIIGLSGKQNLITESMIKSMNRHPIVFALTNPDPEVNPKDAKRWGAFIVATGRSDFPNQVNNALVFPGLFRGTLDVRASKINMEMKIAAVDALADTLTYVFEDKILPGIMEGAVHRNVAKAVSQAAIRTKVARI